MSHLLCLFTDVEAVGTMSTSKPHSSDLIRMDIAQSLPMEQMREVGFRIARIDKCVVGDFPNLPSVQQGQERGGRAEWEMNRSVEFEERVFRVVKPIRPWLTARALISISLGRHRI